MIALALFLALAPPVPSSAPPSTLLPGGSLYLVDVGYEDHSGKARKLIDWRGQPVLLAMFYARCPQACPLLISDVKRVLAAVPERERAAVRVVLVTLDPERDTSAFLAETLKARGLDPAQFTLLRGDAATTRLLAAVLGVRYAPGDDGAIDHTSQIALLDRDGRKVKARTQIGSDVDGFAKDIATVVRP